MSDLISRAEAIRIAEQGQVQGFEWQFKKLCTLPSAEPQKKGKWIEVDDDRISGRCSVCGWEAHLYEDDVVGMDYCPNCGARLLEGEQE